MATQKIKTDYLGVPAKENQAFVEKISQKPDIEDQLDQLPANTYRQSFGLDFDDPETPEGDGPWSQPQLTPKSVTPTDKEIAIKDLIA